MEKDGTVSIAAVDADTERFRYGEWPATQSYNSWIQTKVKYVQDIDLDAFPSVAPTRDSLEKPIMRPPATPKKVRYPLFLTQEDKDNDRFVQALVERFKQAGSLCGIVDSNDRDNLYYTQSLYQLHTPTEIRQDQVGEFKVNLVSYLCAGAYLKFFPRLELVDYDPVEQQVNRNARITFSRTFINLGDVPWEVRTTNNGTKNSSDLPATGARSLVIPFGVLESEGSDAGVWLPGWYPMPNPLPDSRPNPLPEGQLNEDFFRWEYKPLQRSTAFKQLLNERKGGSSLLLHMNPEEALGFSDGWKFTGNTVQRDLPNHTLIFRSGPQSLK